MTINLYRNEYLVKELEGLLSRLNVYVRYEHLTDAKSGLCTFKGNTYLFIERNTPAEDVLPLLKKIILMHDISTLYLPPAVREFLNAEM